MITKVRIIKEKGEYRIQEYNPGWLGRDWEYATGSDNDGYSIMKSFKTQQEAEDYVEKEYVQIIVKEYDVANYERVKDKE